ncbi:MAG: hypothetical protein L3J39_14355 [Verrucomicrobiales bacterium]|nr:hypothetical protein [Verrucomicrobiales bacterium]
MISATNDAASPHQIILPHSHMLTIARFSTTEEAHLFRLRLAVGGVKAFILDEYMVQMDWLISNAIGGVRVQIADDDLELCQQILQEEPCEPEAQITAECPFCQSNDTKKESFTRRLSFLSLFIIGCPLPVAKNSYLCHNCERSWNENKRPVIPNS